MARLVLWDIDHTLLENAGVSKEIYAAAFTEVTGNSPTHQAVTEGRTDPEIMGAMLSRHGRQEVGWLELEQALINAGRKHRSALAARATALPGVPELISALSGQPGVVQSVVTGNIKANALVKLAAVGLDRWLDTEVGGYGSDDDVRSHLIAVAQRHAETKYGLDYGQADSTIVVGDTPRDVQAAKDAGVAVLAVASGVNTVVELERAGATAVLTSLEDTSAGLELILRIRRKTA